MTSPVRQLAWAMWNDVAAKAARAYVAGPDLADALRVSTLIAAHGLSSTICPWDDPGDTARAVADAYIRALRAIGATSLDCYLSIKAPSIAFSPDLMLELVETARPAGTGLHFDSMAPEHADATWDLIRTAARQSAVGCTLPARWRRSVADADEAIALGITVRLVKGQWPTASAPDVDAVSGLLSLAAQLAGRAARVAVATHDRSLARRALTSLRRAGTPCELELLFGFPIRQQMQVARALGVPVRMYVPYGCGWVPYSPSQIRRNPRILWWTARDWVLGGTHDRAIRETF